MSSVVLMVTSWDVSPTMSEWLVLGCSSSGWSLVVSTKSAQLQKGKTTGVGDVSCVELCCKKQPFSVDSVIQLMYILEKGK